MSNLSALQPPQREPAQGALYGLAYYRVSTSDQANTSYDDDGFSIQAQREYCQRKAAEMGVQLVDEFVDRGKSARTADRPALQAMLARINEDTGIQYVFVHKLDRLARSRQDDVQIGLLLAKNGVRLVSCTENIDDSPSGKLVHGIMADIAEWYSANLSEEAKKGLRKKAEHGGTPGKAPLGYVNVRHKIVDLGKDIGVVRIHRKFGPIITECFKHYATGVSTIADIVDYAAGQGLFMPANKRFPERPLIISHMHRILRNRYYTGWLVYDGVAYQGEHQPLIDEATFDHVQALLTARNTRKDRLHQRPHHLKGTLYCGRCGRRLGITVEKYWRDSGVAYPYFYCIGRQKDQNGCTQRYTPIGDVEAAVRSHLQTMRLPAARIRALRNAILKRFAGKHEDSQAEVARQQQRIAQLEQRQQKAMAAYYAEGLTLDEFKREQASIRQGIRAAEEMIASQTVELANITRALDDAFRLVEEPMALYDALPEHLKLLLITTLFDKIWVADARIAGSDLTDPFAELLTLDAQLVLAEHRTRGSSPVERQLEMPVATTRVAGHLRREPCGR